MYDLKRTVFCFLVVYIVNIAAENAADDLDLSRVFRTPKDFSRVNFDHFEILERNNFDPTTPAAQKDAQQSANDTPAPAPTSAPAPEAAQHQPKSVANAQVMLRFGGDDIHGKNCIEAPERASPYHPCPNPHHNHHLQANDIRYHSPYPHQFLPPPPPYGYPYPPYAFPGMYYPTAEFGGPYRDQGHLIPDNEDSCSCSEESKAFLEKSDVCEDANTNHPEIIPAIDLTEEAIPECQKCNGSPVKPPTEKIPHQCHPQSETGPVPFPGFRDDVKKSEEVVCVEPPKNIDPKKHECDNKNDKGPVPFPGFRDDVKESENSSESCSSASNSPDKLNKEHAKEGKWPEVIYVKPPTIDHHHHHHDHTHKEADIIAKIEHTKAEISHDIDHIKHLKEELHHHQHHTTCPPVHHHHSPYNPPVIVKSEHANEDKLHKIEQIKHLKDEINHLQHHTTCSPVYHHHPNEGFNPKHPPAIVKSEQAKEEILHKIDHVKHPKDELHHLQHHTTGSPVHHHHPHEGIKPYIPPVIVKSEHAEEEKLHKIEQIKHLKDELNHHQHHTTCSPVCSDSSSPQNHHHHPLPHGETCPKHVPDVNKCEHSKEQKWPEIKHFEHPKNECHEHQHHHGPHGEPSKHIPHIVNIEHAKENKWPEVTYIKPPHIDHYPHDHHKIIPVVSSPPNYPYHHHPHGETSPKYFPEIVEKQQAEEKKWPEGIYHHHQHPQVIFIDKVLPIAHPKETRYVDILSGEDDCRKCRTHPNELEAWLNRSVVPYDCQVCGHRPKLLITYPLTCNGAPNEHDEDIRVSGCQCCRKHGFCDCCNCHRNPSIPFGQRFPSDMDSLHRVVRPAVPNELDENIRTSGCQCCRKYGFCDCCNRHRNPSIPFGQRFSSDMDSLHRVVRPAVPDVQVYCDERRPRDFSTGYTSGSGSSICASVSQVGNQPPKTYINGYTTSEGCGHYSDPTKDIYYQQPKVVNVIRTPNPCLPVVEHTRFEQPSCYSIVPKKVTPACVPDLVPTDVFVCKQCGTPHHPRMVCHREYVPRGVIEGARNHLGHGEPCQGVFRVPLVRGDVGPVRENIREVPVVPVVPVREDVREVPVVPVREFVAVGPQTYEVCRRFPRQANATEIAADK
ncbi:unnamed protein product [Phaedon cochleariae]|uniref:Uncharacterized protein n=1 Tax=Phaedon cochleariae TaxID=80249 RepID=A0A9P0DDP3_PHACE|nr:unnamed protein product [Phaedon cochleariae]